MHTANTLQTPSLSLAEYLRREYPNERECEFVDGQLEERTGGFIRHGLLHAEVGAWFYRHRIAWEIGCLMSYSLQTSASRVRVPDLVVLKDRLREPIRVSPPLLVVEILCKEDNVTNTMVRLRDMAAMGTGHLWLLDPEQQIGFTYRDSCLRFVESERLIFPNTPIYLDLAELFASLD